MKYMWSSHFPECEHIQWSVCCGHKGMVEENWTEKESEGPLIQEPQGPQLNV